MSNNLIDCLLDSGGQKFVDLLKLEIMKSWRDFRNKRSPPLDMRYSYSDSVLQVWKLTSETVLAN